MTDQTISGQTDARRRTVLKAGADQIDQALAGVIDKSVRYRYVINFASYKTNA